jgi:hypothetical protein
MNSQLIEEFPFLRNKKILEVNPLSIKYVATIRDVIEDTPERQLWKHRIDAIIEENVFWTPAHQWLYNYGYTCGMKRIFNYLDTEYDVILINNNVDSMDYIMDKLQCTLKVGGFFLLDRSTTLPIKINKEEVK